MDKRYQVFISSTYADLKDERQAVIRTVMEMDCIPAGMEIFPAADEEQFEFIKKVIDDCDYYLLIIGGRYGSTAADGTSYTEKEYAYAMKRGLKVIALIHEDPDSIPLGKSEKDPVLRERLRAFREKVSTGRIIRHWKTAEDLPGAVARALVHAIKAHPAVGWIRADRALISQDLLVELNELRKENASLQAQIADLTGKKWSIPDLAGLEDIFIIRGYYYYGSTHTVRETLTSKMTWKQIFAAIAPYASELSHRDTIRSVVAKAAVKHQNDRDVSSTNIHWEDQTFRTIELQLQAMGLTNVARMNTTNGGSAMFWSLTAAGESLMMELRTVRSNRDDKK